MRTQALPHLLKRTWAALDASLREPDLPPTAVPQPVLLLTMRLLVCVSEAVMAVLMRPHLRVQQLCGPLLAAWPSLLLFISIHLGTCGRTRITIRIHKTADTEAR